MIPRKISEKDFVVVKEVSARGKDEHIAALKAREKTIMDHWIPILSSFELNDEPIIHSNKRKVIAADVCSSSVNVASTSGPKEALVTNNSTLEEESRPSTKRKPDALDAENDFGPIKLDGPLHVDDINGADLDGVLCGDIDHGLGDLDDLNIDDYVGTESLEAPKLCPGLSTNTSPVDDDSTISPAFTHGTEDFSVPDKGDPVQTAAPNMDICAEIFVKATEEVLQKALEGSDESTILEPQRQEILRGLILMLPSIPQVAFIRETLEKLTSISTEVQEANGGTSAVSARQSEVVAKAESKVASHDNVLKDSADKLLAAIEINDERKKRVASLNFELAEACSALRRSDAEVTRLNLEQ
ncbi:unnamed protein product [Alopecurus aequalis]